MHIAGKNMPRRRIFYPAAGHVHYRLQFLTISYK